MAMYMLCTVTQVFVFQGIKLTEHVSFIVDCQGP
jgi:hypothetical protein